MMKELKIRLMELMLEAEPHVAMPDIADRHTDPQLASSGLGPGRVHHPCPDDTQFELADAALHAQQKPIVRTTRIIDAIEVD